MGRGEEGADMDEHIPEGWGHDPSGPAWRTEQSVLALIALGVAAGPARLGPLAAVYIVGFVASLVGGDSRWRSKPSAVLVTALCAAFGLAHSLLVAVGEAYWFGSWPVPLLVLAGLDLAWLAPALAEGRASLQHFRRRRRRLREPDAWRDLFRDEQDRVA